MKVGVVILEDRGLDSEISLHFGQCQNFLIADVDNEKIKDYKIYPNDCVHGGGGCVTVDEILKYGIEAVIAGGMGGGAQMKFSANGVKVFGVDNGTVKEALEKFISNQLGGLDECGHHH
jgi:predicted Fe-Mo cluster-binding NifX family protein